MLAAAASRLKATGLLAVSYRFSVFILQIPDQRRLFRSEMRRLPEYEYTAVSGEPIHRWA